MSLKSCFYYLIKVVIGIILSILAMIAIRIAYCYNTKNNCLIYNTPMVINTWAFTDATTKSNNFLITI
jgi:hypothetical protein